MAAAPSPLRPPEGCTAAHGAGKSERGQGQPIAGTTGNAPLTTRIFRQSTRLQVVCEAARGSQKRPLPVVPILSEQALVHQRDHSSAGVWSWAVVSTSASGFEGAPKPMSFPMDLDWRRVDRLQKTWSGTGGFDAWRQRGLELRKAPIDQRPAAPLARFGGYEADSH